MKLSEYSRIQFLHRKTIRTRDFLQLPPENYEVAFPFPNSELEASAIQILLEAEMLLLDGMEDEFTHYYLGTRTLEDFLALTSIKNLAEVQDSIQLASVNDDGDFGVIHLPDSKKNSIVFYATRNEEKEGQFIVLISDGTPKAMSWFAGLADLNNLEDRNMKIAVNLIFYRKAFPHLIRQFTPSNSDLPKEERLYQRNVVRVVAVEGLDDGAGSISPHFRSGHWRTYRSERYTKVRGKVEWISGVFIKGQHKLVEENESYG